ncbi:MAG TPA: response regulator, partial [Candidatus Syntrophosphaera sp.]|nr:response regulator [Candidatus Syntrophosphaera sp.]
MDKLRILLADDDSVFCDLVRELLSANGCTVDAAMNLDQAYQALLNHEYDLMMLDLCFPALSDGFELLDAVHARLP